MVDIILGVDAQTGKPVTLKQKDFALGGYLIGVRRVGKSYLLESLIMQSISQLTTGGVFVLLILTVT